MADVKWIKITTEIFDDEKILLIESLPSADSIIVVWFKLLVLAGKQNNNGVFLMNNSIPYTDEMLAVIFRRDVNTIRLALKAFEQYGMIEIIENVITIPKWNKHQTLDAYEKKKERDRIYQEKRRAEQKLIAVGGKKVGNRSSSDDVSDEQSPCVAVSEEDKEEEKDKNKNRESKKADESPNESSTTRHQYGPYKNVLLSDEDLEKLKEEFPRDYDKRIERLSEYIASTGKKYKNHLATIRSWARNDKEKQSEKNSQWCEYNEGRLDDLDHLF